MQNFTSHADNPAMGGMLGLAGTAAVHGALGWSTFGLAEAVLGLGFATAFPAWVPREVNLTPLTLLSALAYPAIGAALGLAIGVAAGGAGAVLRRQAWTTPTRQAIEAAVMLSVLAGVNVTLAGGDAGRRTVLLCAALSMGLAVASLARAVWPTGRLAVFGSPWFVAFAMAGVLHLTLAAVARGEARGAMQAAASWLACLGGVALIVSWRSRQRPAAPSPAASSVISPPTIARHAVAWLCLLGLAWLGDGGIARAEASEARQPQAHAPNVLLITMDTARRDHLSAYGYARPTTPNLAALAGEATRYTAAVSTGNMTLTSHASIFTGRYPSSHGAVPPAHPLPEDVPTLAERLHAAGYRTAAIVSNRAYLHPSLGLARGFDYYDCRLPGLREAPRPLRFPRDAIVTAYRRVAGEPGARPYYRQAGDITREAVHWIASAADRQRPFLLFLNYMDAHTPYAAPEPYASRFGAAPQGIAWDDFTTMKKAVMAHERRMTAAERRALIDAYDSGIAYADAEIGKVIDTLRARGLFDDTLVIVTADHGEAFDEHGVVEHGVSLYEHQIAVPLIVKLPARAHAEPGRVVRDPVSGADLMPTILDLAGEQLPAGVEGRSLRHLDVDARAAPRHVFAEAFTREGGVTRAAFAPDGRKLLVEGDGRASLFDIAADPREQEDVRWQFPSETARMTAALDTKFALDSRVPGRGPAPHAAADAEVLQRLRALGYVK